MSTKIYASQDWVEEKLSDVTVTIVPSAVNDALAQAKESGEFKGEPGDDYVLTDADKTEIAELAAELVEVPEVSMKPLTFTGAVDATYDGSEEVTVEIPQGGGGSEWKKVAEIKTAEDLTYISITEDMDGNPLSFDEAIVIVGAARAEDATANASYAIACNPTWVSSFNGSNGFHSFPMYADVYTSAVKFTLIDGKIIEAHSTNSKRIAANMAAFTKMASEYFSLGVAYNSSANHAFSVASSSLLNENGKMKGITVGVDLATSVKIGAGSTVEVWVR